MNVLTSLRRLACTLALHACEWAFHVLTRPQRQGQILSNPGPDSVPAEPENCLTCQGRYWNVRHGKWVKTRETVGMVCQACGRDYSDPEAT